MKKYKITLFTIGLTMLFLFQNVNVTSGITNLYTDVRLDYIYAHDEHDGNSKGEFQVYLAFIIDGSWSSTVNNY